MSFVRPVTSTLALLMVTMFFLNILDPDTFSKAFIITGKTLDQVYPWQFITYMFYLPTSIFSVFNIMIFFWFGSNLEDLWGTKLFLIFVFSTVLLHSIPSFFMGFVPVIGGWSLSLCMMVAFGFNFPHEIIYIFFIIPIRVKILAIISLVLIGLHFFIQVGFIFEFKNIDPNAIIQIPRSVGILINTIFSYISLLIFFKFIFGQVHIIWSSKRIKTKKQIERIKKGEKEQALDNRKYLDLFNKTKNGISLSIQEKEILEPLNVEGVSLCDKYDFNADDDHCLKCDIYGNCIKRVINDVL
jgi:membrane associated rhomboid family serine protease